MKSAVLNPRRNPRLLRTVVPTSENVVCLAIGLLLIALVAWVIQQKDQFDPASRDVSIEQLQTASSGLKLHTPPLQREGAESRPVIELAPFPEAIATNDWQPRSAIRTFDANNLYEKINGEAPKFLRQGFQAMHYLVLRNDQSGNEIALELYDQSTVGGSLGVFAEHTGEDRTLETFEDVTFYRTSIGVIGRKGQYFFRAAGDADSDPIRAKSLHIAQVLAKLPDPPQAESTAEIQFLTDTLQVPAENVSFQNQNVFQYDFVSAFWFAKLLDDPPARAFVHFAESAERADRLYGQIIEEHGYEYETREQSDHATLFWHAYLERFFLIQVHGKTLFGVENSSDSTVTEQTAKRIRDALENG